MPVTGGALLLGSFAVLGSPPFGLFLSELTIVRAGFARGQPGAARCCCSALLALAFIAFARTTTGHGDRARRRAGTEPVPGRGRRHWTWPSRRWSSGWRRCSRSGCGSRPGLNTVILHSMAVIT